MSETVLDVDGLTTALITYLATATQRPCGDHRIPQTADSPAGSPYSIVYLVADGSAEADLADSPAEGYATFQMTVVGLKRAQAAALAQRVKNALYAVTVDALATSLAVPGTKVMGRMDATGAGATPSGDVVEIDLRVTLYLSRIS